MRKFKPRDLYYSVQCLRDGTIVFVVPGNKPRNRRIRSNIVDEDGCHGWGEFALKDLRSCSDWGKGLIYGAIVNRLNNKKLLRAQVETHLERIQAQLAEVKAMMERLLARQA